MCLHRRRPHTTAATRHPAWRRTWGSAPCRGARTPSTPSAPAAAPPPELAAAEEEQDCQSAGTPWSRLCLPTAPPPSLQTAPPLPPPPLPCSRTTWRSAAARTKDLASSLFLLCHGRKQAPLLVRNPSPLHFRHWFKNFPNPPKIQKHVQKLFLIFGGFFWFADPLYHLLKPQCTKQHHSQHIFWLFTLAAFKKGLLLFLHFPYCLSSPDTPSSPCSCSYSHTRLL